jgi:hypothetical protein
MWLLVLAGVVVLVVVAESLWQRKRYGRASGRPGLAGVGMLELQRNLQPDRRVEVMETQLKNQDVADAEQDPSGAPGPSDPSGFSDRS